MKAAIVLLAGYKVQNFAREIVVDLSRRYGIDFFASLLPAHVSLKQPFSFERLETLDRYFEALAAGIAPFRVELDELYYQRWNDYGILGLRVVETARLRTLHNQINADLRGLFADPSAPHDGAGYRFHLTIEVSRVDGVDPLAAYFDQLADKRVQLSFEAREIALFYYSREPFVPGSFITYKILPLSAPPNFAIPLPVVYWRR